MKILLLSGASSIHTIRWANALADKNIDIHLVSQHKPVEELNSKVNLYLLPNKGMLGYYIYASKVKKLIKQINPDLINAHYASGYATLARLSNFHPCLLSVWGSDVYDFPKKSFIHKNLVIKNLVYADKVASTSIAMANQTNSLLPNNSLDIAITPFGVDFNNFKNIKYKEDSNKIIIGTIKGLETKYGIDILINAFSLLNKNLISINYPKEVFLQIAGNGPEENNLKQLVKDLKLEEKIQFLGRIEHDLVPNTLKLFDIFVALSRIESFGVAVVEAQAAFLPTVVSNVGGLPEVVENTVSGYVVQCENIEQTASKLMQLINDHSLRKSMGEAGFKNASQKYNWNNNVQTMIDLYSDTIKNYAEINLP